MHAAAAGRLMWLQKESVRLKSFLQRSIWSKRCSRILLRCEAHFAERCETSEAGVSPQSRCGFAGTLPVPPPLPPPFRWRLLHKLALACPHPFSANRVFSFLDIVASMLTRPPVPYPRTPCVLLACDNTVRRRRGGPTILHGSTPSAYGQWLRTVPADQQTLDQLPKPFVFPNAPMPQ